MLLRPRYPGEHLEGGPQVIGLDAFARGGQFMQAQLEPQLACLMNDDEQQLVMRIGRGVLGGEDAAKVEIARIGNVSAHGCAPSAPVAPRELPLDPGLDHAGFRVVLVDVLEDDPEVLGV